MLAELKNKYGVQPHTFVQRLGEAVFIPSGCPHQVKNVRSCFKIAQDFVSPENVQFALKFSDEVRSVSGDKLMREDKLQTKGVVMYAAKNLFEAFKSDRASAFVDESSSTPSKRKSDSEQSQDKRARLSTSANMIEEVLPSTPEDDAVDDVVHVSESSKK